MFTGLLSLRALQEARFGSSADAVLKGAAILYQRTTCFASRATLDAICDRVAVGLTSKQQDALRKALVSTAELDPDFDSFDTWSVLKKLNDWIDAEAPVDIEAAQELAHDFLQNQTPAVVHEAASLYLSLHFDCPFHAHPQEVPRLQKLFSGDVTDVVTEQSPLRFSLPDLDQLAWSDILELRNNRYLERYRLFVANFHLQPNADAGIAEEINAGLWATIGMQAPTASGSAFKRLLGQIPLPFGIPNPYSIYRDVKDGRAEALMFKKYGWLWFIQEAKSLASGAA